MTSRFAFVLLVIVCLSRNQNTAVARVIAQYMGQFDRIGNANTLSVKLACDGWTGVKGNEGRWLSPLEFFVHKSANYQTIEFDLPCSSMTYPYDGADGSYGQKKGHH